MGLSIKEKTMDTKEQMRIFGMDIIDTIVERIFLYNCRKNFDTSWIQLQ